MPFATINSRSVLAPDFLIFPILSHSTPVEADTDSDSCKSKDESDDMHPLCVSTVSIKTLLTPLTILEIIRIRTRKELNYTFRNYHYPLFTDPAEGF